MLRGICPRPAFLNALCLLVSTALCCCTAARAGESVAASRVLILSSYHPGFVSTDCKVTGVQSFLDADTEIFIEYLDAGRTGASKAFLDLFVRQLDLKYGERQPDAIVTVDKEALEFILNHGPALFPAVPAVFCGVEGFEDGMVAAHSQITGVLDDTGIADSLLQGLRLHPDAQRVFVVTDRSAAGAANRSTVESLGRKGVLPAEMVFLECSRDLPLEKLPERLKSVPRDSLVYYAGVSRECGGELLDPLKSLPEISRQSGVPLYAHDAEAVGHGAVGGKQNCGHDLGQAAGRMVARILAGEPVSRIPIERGVPERYTFDYKELKRWSIPLSSLPADSTIINREKSFYESHRGVIWGALVFLVFQSLFIAHLLTNLSRLRKAQDALMESEERLHTIYEAANRVAFVMTDSQEPDGRITEFSLGAERMFGYARDEILGKPVSVLHPRETEADPSGRRPILCEDDVGVGLESTLARKDGQEFSAMTSVYPVHNEKTQQTGALFVTFDVTELGQAREAVRESEEKYRLVVEGANDAIFIAQDGVIKFSNPMTSAMLGYSAEELARIPFAEHIHPDDRSTVVQRHRSRLEGADVPQNYSFRVTDRSGQVLWMQINAVRIQWEARPAALCFLRDITAQKNLEAQLLHAQKMQAIGTLAGGIAHDFNNLLQAILGHADMLLLRLDEQDRAHRGVKQIVRAAQRGSDLTRQLLTFSRKIESRMEALDLNQVLERLRAMLERTIPRMIHVELQPQADLWRVNVDPSQMDQVLMNLALNSRDAMPDGGTLTIETRNVVLDEEYQKSHPEVRLGRYVLLMVSDTGHGMDRETLQRVFDPFFTTKQTGKGTGLGLAMVYGIVKNHEGYISCESEVGVGTRFMIYLPASDLEDTPVETIEPLPPVGGQETILLVDDEEVIREVGADMLGQYGYRVLTAPDGETALEIYAQKKGEIDLVIMDLSMPGMGGRQCLIHLLEMDPHARVVIASGYSFHGPLNEAMELGARSVIHKPYNSSEILEVIRKTLE